MIQYSSIEEMIIHEDLIRSVQEFIEKNNEFYEGILDDPFLVMKERMSAFKEVTNEDPKENKD